MQTEKINGIAIQISTDCTRINGTLTTRTTTPNFPAQTTEETTCVQAARRKTSKLRMEKDICAKWKAFDDVIQILLDKVMFFEIICPFKITSHIGKCLNKFANQTMTL